MPLAVIELLKEQGGWLFDKIYECQEAAKAKCADSGLAKINDLLTGEEQLAPDRDVAESMLTGFIFSHGDFTDSEYMEVASSTVYYFALANWRKTKEVFSFSSELQELIASGFSDDEAIPVNVLEHLPFPCFYLDYGEAHPKFYGVIVEYETMLASSDTKKVSPGIILTFLRKGDKDEGANIDYGYFKVNFADGKTLNEIVKEATQRRDVVVNALHGDLNALKSGVVAADLSDALALLTYLACDNAEIRESNESRQIHKAPKDGIITDRYNEIRKWEVGETITRSIKAFNKEQKHKQASEGVGSSAKKRPHVRAAHFHTFYAGPRDPEKETPDNKRRVVVHWLAPMYINVETTPVNELPVKVTEIQ